MCRHCPGQAPVHLSQGHSCSCRCLHMSSGLIISNPQPVQMYYVTNDSENICNNDDNQHQPTAAASAFTTMMMSTLHLDDDNADIGACMHHYFEGFAMPQESFGGKHFRHNSIYIKTQPIKHTLGRAKFPGWGSGPPLLTDT